MSEDCTCLCHHQRGVKHETACCETRLPIDFWDEYDETVTLHGSSESSKPKGRSAQYEPPSDWLVYLTDHKTGKPKWDESITDPNTPI